MIRFNGGFKFRIFSLFLIFVLLLGGCGSDFASPYKTSVLATEMAGRGFLAELKADSFASDLCVITGDVPVPGLRGYKTDSSRIHYQTDDSAPCT